MKIPEPMHTLASLIDNAHEAQQEPPRPHMGCSQLGHPCDRWLWLSFRWAVVEQFPGRVLRLFRRGQLEEKTLVSDLRAAGVSIHSTEGAQSRVNLGCHISGSIDGIIEYGVPEAPQKRHIVEFKTHSLKSFEDVLKNGVEKSKPQHYTQMQLYMYGTIMAGGGGATPGIDRALYVAICKDDDRIYTERVRFDQDHAVKALQRGKRIVLADEMPPPISTNPSWYQCKFCAAHEFCHKTKLTKQVNCRTCAWSTADENGNWICERLRWQSYDYNDAIIPTEFQRTGCEHHILHDDLVPWPTVTNDEGIQVFNINGLHIRNGRKDAVTFASTELTANPELCTNPAAQAFRAAFDGEVVE
jgi:hypothetical protein